MILRAKYIAQDQILHILLKMFQIDISNSILLIFTMILEKKGIQNLRYKSYNLTNDSTDYNNLLLYCCVD